jgi:hypothetical protein
VADALPVETCCARVAWNIMERFVTLGNLPFSLVTGCNTFQQQKGHPEVAEVPMFIGFLRWLPFVDDYRTKCIVPGPSFRLILESATRLRSVT